MKDESITNIEIFDIIKKQINKDIETIKKKKLIEFIKLETLEIDSYYRNPYCDGCNKEITKPETDGKRYEGYDEDFHFCKGCLSRKLSDSFTHVKFNEKYDCTICEREMIGSAQKFVDGGRKGSFVCLSCIDSPESMIDNFKPLLKILERTQKEIEKKKMKRKEFLSSAENLAKPYIEAGLGEAFALAIGKGVDPTIVMDLWDSDWWKQYPDNDPLIVSVLEGKFSEKEGKYLNEIRSNHQNLVMLCLEGKLTLDWVSTLLNSGFDEHPKSIIPILKGADPKIISRLHRINVMDDKLPPGLTTPVIFEESM